MSGRRRATKKITQGQITGQKGENLIERIVLDMGFVWRSIGGTFDAGIDGRIELRDVRTGDALHREVRVQSKGYAAYTRETDETFEFLCNPADIDYWMRSAEPVILVCSHPNDPGAGDAWFRCVTDWFADKQRRAARRVVFDKRADRFDASCAAMLLHLASSHEPTAPFLPPPPPEHVFSNLLPITEHPITLWSVPTDVTKRGHVARAYFDAGVEDPDWDFVLRDRRLYTLRDPRTTSVRLVADAVKAEPLRAGDWATTADTDRRALWVELLRRTLEHQFRRTLRWHDGERLFYFPAPDPLVSLEIEGPSGPRLVVKVQPNRPRAGETAQGIWYVRHQAFRPTFEFVDGLWCLVVEPQYYFTYDGERPNYQADDLISGIKRLEKNKALISHLTLWQHVLSPPPSLLAGDAPPITIGAPLLVELPIGIDDGRWEPVQEKKAAAPGPGQGEFAA